MVNNNILIKKNPKISNLFESRKPSDIRLAQIMFNNREDSEKVKALNVAIGNVSLPMHPTMIKRMNNLNKNSDFSKGIVRYTPTVGLKETNDSFLNIISSSGFRVDNLYSHIVDGGSMAMELIILGLCGEPGDNNQPILLIDAAYTNYNAMAKRTGRRTISIRRHLHDHGKFALPNIEEIEKVIEKEKPNSLVVIPYDNPTGHFYDHKSMKELAKLCVKYNMWMVSDEAYRELHYVDEASSSIWGLTDEEIPGIEGRRISIETASKVWNACGLRIGAIVTDNKEFHEKAVAEATANLCAPVIDQYIFGALAEESKEDLNSWYEKQRNYYGNMLLKVSNNFKKLIPKIIVSSPDASIYSVIDMRNIDPNFNAKDFVKFCAKEGKVKINNKEMTLLVAPMEGFYKVDENEINPGKTQMRIAYVLNSEEMNLVPELFVKLYEQYKKTLQR